MLSFDPLLHEYHASGRLLPSVTTIMRATGLVNGWSIKEDPQYRMRGQAAHEAARLIDTGEYSEEGTHELIRPYARQYRQFVSDIGFIAHGWEISMAHITLGFAGTFDIVGLDKNGDVLLIDVKTGSSMPQLVGVQLAAYEQLIIEGADIPKSDEPQLRNWASKLIRDHPKTKLRKRCLHLPGGDVSRGVLKSFDEPRWSSIWRGALNVYNARKEAGLL
jgi:hypothetical protein